MCAKLLLTFTTYVQDQFPPIGFFYEILAKLRKNCVLHREGNVTLLSKLTADQNRVLKNKVVREAPL